MGSPGDIVDGRFELIARIGGGGMGTVWRARDTLLDRDVALKAVRQDTQASEVTRRRVLREARVLARLSSPHVVTVHHVVEAEPHPWIVMELVPGASLEERLADGPLSPVETARIGRQVLAALRAAHRAGILHRDVKPANIVLRADGSVVLVDFGIAALQDLPAGQTALTGTDQLIGTPEYVAPERIRGEDAVAASDLWSLGIVLYTSVEGARPFRRATPLATLAAVREEPAPPASRAGSLAPVLEALLVKDPAARPGAAELDAMLERVELGAEPGEGNARTVPLPVPPPEPGLADADTVTAGTGRPPAEPGNRASADRTPRNPWPGDREPAAAGRRSSMPLVLTAALVTAAVVATAVGLWLGVPDGERGTTGGPRGRTDASGSSAPAVTPTGSDTAAPGPSSSAGLSPSRSPSPGVTDPFSSAPPPQDTPPSGRGWIAQLFSEPVSSGTATRDRRLAAVREYAPDAVFLHSSDYASLRPGYWVIYAAGPFTDGRAALEYCAERGLTHSNKCIGRYLSNDSDDFGLQCRPPVDQPKGRCSREEG